jgi:hypothetical protein
MRGKAVYDAVTSVVLKDGSHMPCAHMAFPIGNAPNLPWCVYYLDETEGIAADNRLHVRRNRWIVEHYWKDYDEEAETALEMALEQSFGVFTITESWVDTENCMETAYYFTEIEKESEADESE